jgi:hypothetical protein
MRGTYEEDDGLCNLVESLTVLRKLVQQELRQGLNQSSHHTLIQEAQHTETKKIALTPIGPNLRSDVSVALLNTTRA